MLDSVREWTWAVPDDEAKVLLLMREFYHGERLVFDEEKTPRALSDLLGNPDFGLVFLLREGTEIRGYMIATLGFSVEFGGRFALLDELFILPAFRGHGDWTRGLGMMEEWARKAGISAIRLEVNHHNEIAREIYLKTGFEDDRRAILTRRIPQDRAVIENRS